MANSWITRVKKYAIDNGVSYKEALQACKGGSHITEEVNSRDMFDVLKQKRKLQIIHFKKIKNPSQWLIWTRISCIFLSHKLH